MKRRQAREYALQMLFQSDFSGTGSLAPDGFQIFWKDRESDGEVIAFTEKLVRGTYENLKELDELIIKTAEHWVLERMAAVDRNILRIAAYELCHMPEIPSAVIINEAIEIAKKYSSRDSSSFINGILDKLRKSVRVGV